MLVGGVSGAITIDQLLRGEQDHLTSLSLVDTLNVSCGGEGPTSPSRSLVLHLTDGTLISPVESIRYLDIGSLEIALFGELLLYYNDLRYWSLLGSHQDLLSELLLSKIRELIETKFDIRASHLILVHLGDDLNILREYEESYTSRLLLPFFHFEGVLVELAMLQHPVVEMGVVVGGDT